MLRKIREYFSKSKSPGLSIIRPDTVKTHVFELDYATQFCENSITAAARTLNLKTQSVNLSDQISEKSLNKYVLFFANPGVLINSQVLAEMIGVINSGADACGPCFNSSETKQQQAHVIFPIYNVGTIEEHNAHKLAENAQTEKTDELDKSCILCTRAFYLKHRDKFHATDKESMLKSEGNSKLLILKNSLAFVFPSTYGAPRRDLIDLIPDQAMEILEVGCAEGSMGKLLKEIEPGKNVDAVEMSVPLAEKAKPYYRKTYATAFEEFMPELRYDAIICGDVIEHMVYPWQQISRMFEMLKSGGYLITSLPNAGHWTLVKDMLKGKFEYLPFGITCITHLRWFTEESIKTALQDSGFEIEVFNREQIEPSPEGKKFIDKMAKSGYGNEQSLLTNEFTIRAVKQQ